MMYELWQVKDLYHVISSDRILYLINQTKCEDVTVKL